MDRYLKDTNFLDILNTNFLFGEKKLEDLMLIRHYQNWKKFEI